VDYEGRLLGEGRGGKGKGARGEGRGGDLLLGEGRAEV